MGSNLDGRLILLTGASTGIGRAAAAAFVAAGARVVGVARSRERLEQLSEQLGGSSWLIPVVADVSDAASVEQMASHVLDRIGLPDVIVANAGIGLDALFSETDDASLRSIFETNVFGVFSTLRPFVPRMIERGHGRLLVISSVVGKRGLPHYSAYSASKFALHGMLDSLRAELHGTGVSAGIVCPSSTESEFQDRMRRTGPKQRSVRPLRHSAESVARAIVRMARSRRREMVLSPEGKFLIFADSLVPAIVDRILASLMARRR